MRGVWGDGSDGPNDEVPEDKSERDVYGDRINPNIFTRFADLWRTRWEEYLSAALITAAAVVCVVGAALGIRYLYLHTPAPLAQGEVQGRHFEPAHRETYLRPEIRTRLVTRTECTYSNGQSQCRPVTETETYTEWVPDTRWVPDVWTLKVYGCSEDRSHKIHCRTETVTVGESEYDSCGQGYTWRRDIGCSI